MIRQLYERFGMVVSPAFDRRLDEEAQKARAYQSSHHYSFDDVREITREQVLSDLGHVFERFGFDTRPPPE